MNASFARYIVGRLAIFPLLIFIISLIVFVMGRVAPGDPVLLRVGPRASDATIERVRHELDLDKPLMVQYGYYMKDFLTGDMGESFVLKPGESVTDVALPRMKISGPLNFISFGIALVLGTAIGLLASIKRGTWLDSGSILFFLAVASIPSLIMVQYLIVLLALKWGLVPAGWTGDWHSVFSTNAVIPILTLTLSSIVGIALLTRSSTISVMGENYVRTAKAKGLPSWVIAWRYVLRNASLPLLTYVGGILLLAFEGSIFIERLYGIPGMGQLYVEAIFARDYDILTSLTLVVTIVTILSILVTDILYKVFDPRVDITKRT